MKVFIYYEEQNKDIANMLKDYLTEDVELFEVKKGEEVIKLQELSGKLLEKTEKEVRGIYLDDYSYKGALIANKIHKMIAAPLYDEHSAKMTIGHNSTKMVSVGTKIIGIELIKSIIDNYLTHNYDAGRHQIRIDMLNKLC